MDAKLLLLCLAVLFATLVFVWALEQKSKMTVRRRLQGLNGRRSDDRQVWKGIVGLVASKLTSAKDRAQTQELMMGAGFPKSWQTDAFICLRTFLFLSALIAGYIFIDIDFSRLFAKPLPPLEFLFLLFVAGRLPGWVLTEMKKRRQNRIRLFIPKAVDMLTICMDCGMSLEDALERISDEIQKRAPEVANEFRMARYEMLVIDRVAALSRMKKRTGVTEMEELAGSLLQSIQFGTPLTEALRTIAAEARADQISELEQKAGRVSASIGIPLIVLVLFPVLALIAAPAVINLARTLTF
ncbi:MAG: type II secretion system F family protein [Sutterellaceae bacterium]|nr:type II secretion system F family protein [Sutterellaceae bacterium]